MVVGKMVVALQAHTKHFQKGIRRAGKQIAAFAAKVKMAAFAAGALLAAGIALSVRSFVRYGDEVAKMAKRTGLSTEAVSELAHAAEISGASMESLEKGVKRMAKTITDASDGLITYERAFVRIGLTSKELVGLDPEEAFMKIGAAIGGIEDAVIRAAAAQDIFGRAGTRLLPLFAEGAEGIAKMREEAKRLGISMSIEVTRKAELLQDSFTRVKASVLGLAIEIGTVLTPYIEALAVKFTDWTVKAREWIESIFDNREAIHKWAGKAQLGFAAIVAMVRIAVQSVIVLSKTIDWLFFKIEERTTKRMAEATAKRAQQEIKVWKRIAEEGAGWALKEHEALGKELILGSAKTARKATLAEILERIKLNKAYQARVGRPFVMESFVQGSIRALESEAEAAGQTAADILASLPDATKEFEAIKDAYINLLDVADRVAASKPFKDLLAPKEIATSLADRLKAGFALGLSKVKEVAQVALDTVKMILQPIEEMITVPAQRAGAAERGTVAAYSASLPRTMSVLARTGKQTAVNTQRTVSGIDTTNELLRRLAEASPEVL